MSGTSCVDTDSICSYTTHNTHTNTLLPTYHLKRRGRAPRGGGRGAGRARGRAQTRAEARARAAGLAREPRARAAGLAREPRPRRWGASAGGRPQRAHGGRRARRPSARTGRRRHEAGAAQVAAGSSAVGTLPSRRWATSRRSEWPEELIAPKALIAKKERRTHAGRGCACGPETWYSSRREARTAASWAARRTRSEWAVHCIAILTSVSR